MKPSRPTTLAMRILDDPSAPGTLPDDTFAIFLFVRELLTNAQEETGYRNALIWLGRQNLGAAAFFLDHLRQSFPNLARWQICRGLLDAHPDTQPVLREIERRLPPPHRL